MKRGAVGGAPALRALGVMGASAIVVSLPLLYSIVGFYQMRVVNPTPGSWLFRPSFAGLVDVFLAPSTSLALVGAVWAWRRRMEDPDSEIFFAAGATCVVAVVFRYATGLQSLAPSHHFVFYLKALEALFFGVGVAATARFLSTRVTARLGRPATVGTIAFWGSLGLFTLWFYPAYPRRTAFTEKAVQRSRMAGRRPSPPSSGSSRRRTQRTFSCDDRNALFAIGPAGLCPRCTRICSNPYVNWELRDQRRNASEFLQEGHEERFREYTTRNRISYVMFDENRQEPDHPLNRKSLRRLTGLRPVFQRGLVTIYKVE
jgi:hypothetical protein